MAQYHDVQKDFSGGEISQRMFMRDDLEVHQKSLLTMENFMPTLQGTAIRTPGTRFLWEIKDAADNTVEDARIIPYITPDGQYAVVELIPKRDALAGEIRLRANIADAVGSTTTAGPADPDATYTAFKPFVANDTFNNGLESWITSPNQFEQDTIPLGVWESPGQLFVHARDKGGTNNLAKTCLVTTTATVPEDTDRLQIAPAFQYVLNSDDTTEGKFDGTISVGTTAGGTDVWTYDFSDWEVGQQFPSPVNLATDTAGDPLAITAGTVLHLTFTLTAKRVDGINSAPRFVLQQFRLLSKRTIDVRTQSVSLNNTSVDYTPEEIKDVQFVQSPYHNSGTQDEAFGNELVLVHPNHAPKRLYFNQGVYVLAEIPFIYVNEDGNGTGQGDPAADYWADSYPAACSSYLGRLVLAGGNKSPTLGSVTGSNTERVWMTYVGKWYAFSDPANTTVTTADSIEFSSTYRSPIQWVHGQTNLLIGAESYEYVSNSDGIYGPGDLGVFLQSTHGTEAVQPVPMGQYVLFAAEQGSRVRAMQYIAESEYWVSPDMTIYHPDLFSSGIKRMVRMRNPHQMCVCVMGDGHLAVLHQDSYANISGWSRMLLGSKIQDICVQPGNDGTDILYILIRRNIEGEERLYLEAISDWSYKRERQWNYLRSAVTYIPDTKDNVITGLDHLEGKVVQVVSGANSYFGDWVVEGGQITLTKDSGEDINVDSALVGMPNTARIRTMPQLTEDPGSKKRFASIYVRARSSSRPIINGQRPADRDPFREVGLAQDLDIIQDYEIEEFTWNRTQVIEVREDLPIRTEVVGIYGKVSGNSVS